MVVKEIGVKQKRFSQHIEGVQQQPLETLKHWNLETLKPDFYSLDKFDQ